MLQYAYYGHPGMVQHRFCATCLSCCLSGAIPYHESERGLGGGVSESNDLATKVVVLSLMCDWCRCCVWNSGGCSMYRWDVPGFGSTARDRGRVLHHLSSCVDVQCCGHNFALVLAPMGVASSM